MEASRRQIEAARLEVGDYLCFSHRIVVGIEEISGRVFVQTRHPMTGSERLHRWTVRTPVWVGQSPWS